MTQRQAIQTPTSTSPGRSTRSTTSSRRQRERDEIRARLLAAARDVAVREGWHSVTIRRIADRMGYASPILYQHFSSKEALLLELVKMGFREVTEGLTAAGQASAEDVLETLAHAYWTFAFSARELYQVMHGLDGVPFGSAATPGEAQAAFRAVRSALIRLAAARDRHLADPDGAVDTVWAYLHGFVSLAMSGRIAGGPDRAWALLLRGLPPLFDSLLG